ncbi:MAG TPA: acyl-CoA dehydrogenase family protein [Candidatus Acidoferrales bacterium]|nr:acyl-CoA dehydrogenase family protein [Candidatus Acidoferrales bacterium]
MAAYELAFATARKQAAASVADWARRTGDELARELAEAAASTRPEVSLLTGIAARFLGGAAVEDLGASTEHRLLRRTIRDFAERVIKPRAQQIHREDRDLPEDIIQGAARLGLFGLSVPEAYGGSRGETPDLRAMLIATEELSRASLTAGGSLITRPEILVQALLSGGTEAQKRAWLPAIATGRQLVAVAVTEPDFGSDVAGIKCRAERVAGGWQLNGAKLWCTFAGRAELLMVLCRTAPGGHRGLSLFVAEKPAFSGREFEHRQPHGGRLRGRAIPTIGYRGMHSFELNFEDYRLPEDALVGGEAGLNRGFYLQMEGFAPGRLQTAGRAVGLMQAALEDALAFTRARHVFGRPVAAHQLPQATLGRLAVAVSSARQLSYVAAERLQDGAGQVEASLAKLHAARLAELVTRDAMQLFGGLGYAEETDVSRYFVDARVLTIFEGAEEVLALRVIARSLLEGGPNDAL